MCDSTKRPRLSLFKASETEEEQSMGNEIDFQEEKSKDSSFDHTFSNVDSAKYSEEIGEEGDEAFFEQLADMTAMLDAESESDDTRMRMNQEVNQKRVAYVMGKHQMRMRL
jgi:hypothetical protein